ncbi:eukaryotic translation initiation factor 2-alpha kinase 1-like [Amphibalanus amphitrite]|uniref:eukaryotic translation initiation factor 2-alpha kinase 1-like n=1 Tax=Amphibalanus amphitrite TaxID=1232801 RepID=UPI001C91B1B3|nr:eukaryotic translation initiation factor 2-alpha kinase 1-like [Amphibalanus amphitrite]
MPTPCRSAGSVPVAGRGRRRPRTLGALPPLPAPVTALDGGPAGAADSGTVAQLIETAVPSYLTIEALVELACRSQRGTDWRSMYTLVHRQLVSMRLLPPHSDQLDPLRHMYQKMFADLLVAAHRASLPGPLTDAPLLGPAPSEPSAPLLHPSRYRTEFEELSLLGSGGFAVVSRCRSLVDRQEYAVKRIPFRCRSAAAAERTLREVTVLASLDHPNIVKYNTAWLEAGGPRPTGRRNAGGSDAWTELAEGETNTGAGSLGSVSALPERERLPATDSSVGSEVTWERDSKTKNHTAEVLSAGPESAQNSNGTSSHDSSSGVVFNRVAAASARTPDSSESRRAGADPLSSEEPTASRTDASAAPLSQNGSSGSSAPAVLPAGTFGARGTGAARGGGGRFWAGSGSSSGSTSVSSAAARHAQATRSLSAASACAVAQCCVPRYRRTLSAPAATAGWLTLYIQMQPCERTLKDWLHDRNLAPPPASAAAGDRLSRVDAEGCRRLLRDVLLGLHFIHQRGIIHRDLKPANIFLAFSGRAMIGDFGLARVRAAAGDCAESCGGGSPRPGDQTCGVGTATYASPEQAASGDYDQSTDLYSLGVVLYELFAPFTTAMERSGELRRLRHERRCAEDVTARWPAVADAVLALTDDERARRPCAAHLLTSPLFSSAADRLLQLEAAAAHQGRLLEARAARGRQLAQQLDSCRHEAAVTERLLRNTCSQLRRQLAEKDREVEKLRQVLRLHGIEPP